MNNLLMVASLFLITLDVFANEQKEVKAAPRCFSVMTNVIYDQKNNETTEKVCKYVYEEITYYVSESCALGNCGILKNKKKKIKVPDYKSTLGSPGFKICEALGGTPQIYSFKSNELGNEKTDRCFIGTADFVEVSLLSQIYSGLIE